MTYKGMLKDKGGCKFEGNVLKICGKCELVIIVTDHCVFPGDPKYDQMKKSCSRFSKVTKIKDCDSNGPLCEFEEKQEGAGV